MPFPKPIKRYNVRVVVEEIHEHEDRMPTTTFVAGASCEVSYNTLEARRDNDIRFVNQPLKQALFTILNYIEQTVAKDVRS